MISSFPLSLSFIYTPMHHTFLSFKFIASFCFNGGCLHALCVLVCVHVCVCYWIYTAVQSAYLYIFIYTCLSHSSRPILALHCTITAAHKILLSCSEDTSTSQRKKKSRFVFSSATNVNWNNRWLQIIHLKSVLQE